MPSRSNLKSMKMLASGAQPNAVFGSSSEHYDAFPIESEVDDDILVRVQVLRRFLTESEVDDDIGKR